MSSVSMASVLYFTGIYSYTGPVHVSGVLTTRICEHKK